jgi:predicted ArsR family transcriptional regulator
MTGPRKTGRHPVDRRTPGRDQIWDAIRRRTDDFTIADVAAACGADRKTIRDYLACLSAGGYVEHTPAPVGHPASYRMLRDTGIHAPRLRADGSAVQQGNITEQLWRGMYILREFTFRDLIETASIDISEDTARAYCKMLLATGYLKVMRKADPTQGRIAKYRLVRDSGQAAPQVQRVKRVYDPNTGLVHHPEGLQ